MCCMRLTGAWRCMHWAHVWLAYKQVLADVITPHTDTTEWWSWMGVWRVLRCCDWQYSDVTCCFYRAMLRRVRSCHSKSSVCPSVCMSAVHDVHVCFHARRNTSKIISRPNSLRHLLKLTNSGDLVQRKHPQTTLPCIIWRTCKASTCLFTSIRLPNYVTFTARWWAVDGSAETWLMHSWLVLEKWPAAQ